MTPKPRFYNDRRRWQDEARARGEVPECGREACHEPASPAWVNAGTPLLYCRTCATLINRYNPGLCTPEEPTDAALLDRWAGALARLAEGPTEYGPHDVEALAATTERMVVENARLRAELAEALATLANERGEGEPPCEGWERNDIDTRREGVAWHTRWEADGSEPGYDDTEHTHVAWVRREEGCMVEWMWEIERSLGWLLDGPVASGRALTAREAMRDASAAKGGVE